MAQDADSKPIEERGRPKLPFLSYTLAILEITTVVVLAFVLYFLTGRNGGINAPRHIVYKVRQYPQLSIQVISILSSFITWVIMDGLGKAITLAAQKRLFKYRSAWEIEWWASLKVGRGFIKFKEKPRRLFGSFLTVLLAIFRVLIFAGLTVLLLPLPYKIDEVVVGDIELDVSRSSTECRGQWDTRQLSNFDENCDPVWLNYKGFQYQICDSPTRLFESLEAAQASMLDYVMRSTSTSGRESVGSSFSQLEDMRVVGTTSGVVPIGPGGISPFSGLWFSDASTATSQLFTNGDYSLNLQGISVNVTCQYSPPTAEFPWPPTLENNSTTTASQYVSRLACPEGAGGSTGERRTSAARADGVIMAHSCHNQGNSTWTYYLRSAFHLNQTDSSTSAYAGIGSMACSIEPQFQSVKARFNPEFDAFDLTDVSKLSNQSVELYEVLSARTLRMFTEGKLQGSVHLVASLVDAVAGTRYKLPVGIKDERYPPLIASMIKGVFEYQATKLRLVSTFSNIGSSGECFRSVGGTTVFYGFGWKRENNLLSGIVPLSIVVIASVALVIWASLTDDKVRLFDPTNPVSLIVAASAGDEKFTDGIVGDPLDKRVLDTRVKFQLLENGDDKRWGFSMKGNSLGHLRETDRKAATTADQPYQPVYEQEE